MQQDLLKIIPYHNNEEMVKICNDLISYSSEGIRSLREQYGENIPAELLPHMDYYKNTISTCSEFLERTGNWFKV